MTHRNTFLLGAVLIMALIFTGCAKHAPVHPGSANAFDSTTYDALVTIQAGIEQAKTNLPDSKKPLLNQIIDDYNKAQAAYKTYHNFALAGTATAAQQASLQAQIDSLKANVAKLGAK